MPPLPTLNPYGFCANGCPTANSATSSNRGGTSVNSDAGRHPDGYTLNANRHILVLLCTMFGLMALAYSQQPQGTSGSNSRRNCIK